ncbi:MAG: penicillin-binding protein 2, partial [Clostridia bacterium]|nr:penicillin-binding protein 2 [Clostridia bacterium]
CAIANDGKLMRPYVVNRIENHKGKTVKKTIPFSYRHLMDRDESAKLKQYMRAVVTNGTGRMLNTNAYEAACKTGTAEYSSDKSKSHSLFVGFANVDDPEIVTAVVVENADTSGVSATAIAKAVSQVFVLGGGPR